MVLHSGRPLTGPSPRYPGGAKSGTGSAGGTLRMLGRRRMTKFRFRMMIVIYLALGCIIPYYIMKHVEQEEFSRQHQLQEQQNDGMILQEQERQHRQQEEMQLQYLNRLAPIIPEQADERQGLLDGGQGLVSEDNPRGYRRRPFFEDLVEVETSTPDSLSEDDKQMEEDPTLGEGTVPLLSGSIQHSPEPSSSHPTVDHIEHQKEKHLGVLDDFRRRLKFHRQLVKIHKIQTVADYETIVKDAISETHNWVQDKMLEEVRWMGERERIPGTGLDTAQKARRFRALMDQALNAGRWVYEAHRDYPDFGGATGWNKKGLNERDRDVTIDRRPFPEAGKYHWEPLPAPESPASSSGSSEGSPLQKPLGEIPSAPSTTRPGWHANRIPPEEFCELLGPRHIVLVGDLIHWHLHDSIMYNMFDNPQACYGDLACSIGVGHPLCPLPDDVRLKFVRNDLLSPIRPIKSKSNETKSQDPVEISWIRDMNLKDTIILGASHFSQKDHQFRRRLTETVTKIRIKRPDALIIYRNNPVGHPECPSKANDFNRLKTQEREKELERLQQPGAQKVSLVEEVQYWKSGKKKKRKWLTLIPHYNSTFAAAPKPFDEDIPIPELLDYPWNWVHYDRQNQIAKVIIESVGGIYWNVATMTNMRPDGHVGGQDCLSYKRPGPTDEWAVSLYNLFKTIHQVEQEVTTA